VILRRLSVIGLVAACALASVHRASAQTAVRKIGELDLRLVGLSATVSPAQLTVPKNVATGVPITLRAGSAPIGAGLVAKLLGGPYRVEGELSGPGFAEPLKVSQPAPSDPASTAQLLLPLPPMAIAGAYSLSNLRLVLESPDDPDGNGNGVRRSLLDVMPGLVTIDVIDQVLVTSVKTRPLTLDEIKDKGIVLDSDDYLAFEFTIGMKLESKAVNLTFPVVFDKQGLPLPENIVPSIALPGLTEEVPAFPEIVPVMLRPPRPITVVVNGVPEEVKIPSILVIPGNVGYLKQFFSAQLFVANGAPLASALTVRDISGSMNLPKGADLVAGTEDDPLKPADTVNGVQPLTMPVRAPGADGVPGTADDVERLAPAEQGMAEFLIRGDGEGFHKLSFDVNAVLEGLPTGPVTISGQAIGGVLVRNPDFDMTFTVPSVVRRGERFRMYAAVTNIGQGLANDVSVTIDASRLSGAQIVGSGTKTIDTLQPGDSKTLAFELDSEVTGQVVATYLRLDPRTDSTARLKFTLGVGERGVVLSPDTLVLPAQVSALPEPVVDAAMRVLGQAWSIANAWPGTLPSSVARIDRAVVKAKALALAEGGLRVMLGEPQTNAVRDLLTDFAGGSTLDTGFDQLLRQTHAGRAFLDAAGAALAADAAPSPLDFEHALSTVAASGPDFLAFAVASSGARPHVAVLDAAGRRTDAPAALGELPVNHVRGASIVPLGDLATAPVLGLIALPAAAPYTIELTGRDGAPVDLSVTFPRVDGTFGRAERTGISLAEGERARIVVNPGGTEPVTLERDATADGAPAPEPIAAVSLSGGSPQLLGATVIGPETLPNAPPFGMNVALLFDRVVDAAAAGTASNYAVPNNTIGTARRQLSGRVVFLSLRQPEGPYVPTRVTVQPIADGRGVPGLAATETLASRLEDPGAVVSGRILNPDGTPVVGATVYYENNLSWDTCETGDTPMALAAVQTDTSGHYQFRYVRQDTRCGRGWTINTVDGVTGSLRRASGYVRFAGEQIVLDLVLYGKGAVSGVVRDLFGNPVPSAIVLAVSETDPLVFGQARADGDGRYTIPGLVVGPLVVRAVSGLLNGSGTAYLARAGTTAPLDITLNSGSVRLEGTVRRVESGVAMVAPGMTVSYKINEGTSLRRVAITTSDVNGRYVFESVPAGSFVAEVRLDTGDRGEISGIAAVGDVLTGRDITVSIERTGRVSGTVRLPDGTPSPNTIVTTSNRGVLTGADGSFDIQNVPVQPNVAQEVRARTRDLLRTGRTSVVLNQPGEHVSNVTITLSGLGYAEFQVVDPEGAPLVGQEVLLLYTGESRAMPSCVVGCGCALDVKRTDAEGKVVFANLPPGPAKARAMRFDSATGMADVAEGVAVVPRDGETGHAVLRFGGVGTISGLVTRADNGQAVFGAIVQLQSIRFDYTTCALASGGSHRLRTDESGRFTFNAVNVGPLTVTASQEFFPTPVAKRDTLLRDGDHLTMDLALVNTIAGELSGTVFMPDGMTPAGAGIEVTANGVLPDVKVTTNDQGHYQFAKIFPQGRYALTARDPVTGGVAQASIFLMAGANAEHDLRLKGRGTVHVRVVDGAGLEVPTASVRLEEMSFPSHTHDGAVEPANQGVVTFAAVFEGPFTVNAVDPLGRAGRVTSTMPGPDITVDVTVQMTTTGTVRGTFVMPDGTTPVPYATVRLWAGNRRIAQTATRGGAEAGYFEFTYVPAGDVRVEAEDPVTARSGIAAGRLQKEGEFLDLTIVAQGIGTVTGTITSNGVPTAARVEIVSGAYKADTSTAADGTYRIEGVPEGRIVATASLVGDALAGTASATLAGDGTVLTLDVALRPSGTVEGQVFAYDGVTPAPLSEVSIQVGGFGGGTVETSTDPAGLFRLTRVPAGRATIRVQALGSIDRAQSTVEVAADAVTDTTLALNGVGALSGVAYDSAGLPVEGWVTIQGTGTFPYSLVVQTGADGAFSVSQLLAGPVTLSLRVTPLNGPALYGTASRAIAAGTSVAIDVHLQDTGIVRGIVLRPDGVTPAIGAEVTIVLDANRGSVRVQSLSDGRFEAVAVPLGIFSVRIHDPLGYGEAFSGGLVLAANGEVVELPPLALDDSPIGVVSIVPAQGARDVAVNAPIVLTFSDPLQGPEGVQVWNGSTWVNTLASLSSDGRALTLTGGWPDSAELTVKVTTAVTDVYGRRLAEAVTSTFRTVDLTPPAVSATTPAKDAIQVVGGSAVTVVFSEPLGPATDPATLISLVGPAGAVAGETVLDGATAVFTPALPLPSNTLYTLTISGATDPSGNVQPSPWAGTFATLDTIPPTLSFTQPGDGGEARVSRPTIEVAYSDNLTGANLSTVVFRLDDVDVEPTAAVSVLRFTPSSPLAPGWHTLHVELSDRAGLRAMLEAIFTVRLDPVGTIRGRVLRADGVTPAASIRVKLDGTNRSFDTQADGAFVFTEIPLGTYSLSATNYYGQLWGRELGLAISEAGQEILRDIVLVGLGTVTGHVTRPDGSAAQYVSVSVASANPIVGGLRSASTNTSGDFTVTKVPVGTFTITATDSALKQRKEATGALTYDGETVTVNLQLASNSIALPSTLWDGNGFTFDVQANGSIRGTNTGFVGPTGAQNAFLLDVVSGTNVVRFTGSTTGTVEEGGRELVTSQNALAGVNVTRKIFVPPGSYAGRYLELLTNPGAAPVTVGVRITANMKWTSGGGSPRIISSSSGDDQLTTGAPENADRWVTFDDGTEADPFTSTTTLPAVAVVFEGLGAGLAAGPATFTVTPNGPGTLVYEWPDVTIGPGETVGFMHFGVQQVTRAAAQAAAERLVQLPPEVLAGLTAEETAAVRNFVVPADGLSAVPAIPLGGVITGRVLGGDGTTVVPNAPVSYRSLHSLYPRTYTVNAGSDGTFTVQSQQNVLQPRTVPLAPFTLAATFGSVTSPSVNGDFAPEESTSTADIVFSNAGIVTGTVLKSAGGTATGGTVAPISGSPSSSIAADGSYAIRVINPGTYTLRATSTVPCCISLYGERTVTVTAGQSTAADIALEPTGTVTGTIARGSAAPVSGAYVTLKRNEDSRNVYTNATGQYVFTDVPVGSFTVQTADGGVSYVASIGVAAGQTTQQDFTFYGVGTVNGTVRYGTGVAASGVSVELRDQGSYISGLTTGSTGAYSFSNVPVARPMTVRVFFPSRWDIYRDHTVTLTAEGQTLTQDVFVPALATVRVTALTASGAPLPDARVQVQNSQQSWPNDVGYTDASGRLDISDVPEGPFTVIVGDPEGLRAPGRSSGRVANSDQGSVVPVTVRLPVSGTVRGHVYAADGDTPVGFSYVNVRDGMTGDWVASTQADASGSFEFVAVSTSSGQFLLEAAEYTLNAQGSTTGSVLEAQAATADVVIPVGVVKGVVRFTDGTPVPGPSMYATRDPVTSPSLQFRAATGDASGAYVLLSNGPGDFTATAQHDVTGLAGSAGGTIAAIEVPVILDITLQPSGTVTGLVRDGAGGPVPSASVYVTSSGLSFSRSTTTDASGVYRVDYVALGNVTVTAYGPGALSATGTGALTEAGQVVTIDVQLPATGTLSGTVYDEAGAPVPSARVYVEYPSGAAFGLLLTTADAAGGYTKPDVTAGPVRVAAVPPAAQAPAGFADVNVAPYATTSADVRFGTAAYVFGLGLTDGAGFKFEPYCDASLRRGGNAAQTLTNAYTVGYQMTVDGVALPCRYFLPFELSKRQVWLGPVSRSSLTVNRKVYVPGAGHFARYVDTFTNPGLAPVSASIEIVSTLGSGASTRVVAAPADTGNTYALTDQNGGCCTPLLGHVFAGPAPAAAPSVTIDTTAGRVIYRWALTLAAGEAVTVLHFAVQHDPADAGGAIAQVQALVNLSDPDALTGLAAEDRQRVVNFSVPLP